MIKPGGIAPPADHFELGDRVRYHHRCCEARYVQVREGAHDSDRFWNAVGIGKKGLPWPDWFEDSPFDKLPKDGKLNKTIVVWPEEGEGVLVAMLRRGIGVSNPGYQTYDFEYGPDYEQGWFDTKEWHWLYAVKHSLNGMNVVLVPMWATEAA